jgi:hypothetical protein
MSAMGIRPLYFFEALCVIIGLFGGFVLASVGGD